MEELVKGNRRTEKIRFVERDKPKNRDLFCTREECKPCEGKPESCRQRNLTYQITCISCKAIDRTSQYFGESSRTWWDRDADHVSALRTKNERYAIVKHWVDKHRELEAPLSTSSRLWVVIGLL